MIGRLLRIAERCDALLRPPFAEAGLASGDFDALEWGVDQLALSCASHGGEPEHVALAERMLYDLGLEEGDLACGVTEPLSPRGVRILRPADYLTAA